MSIEEFNQFFTDLELVVSRIKTGCAGVIEYADSNPEKVKEAVEKLRAAGAVEAAKLVSECKGIATGILDILG